jgi:hypothetical protein
LDPGPVSWLGRLLERPGLRVVAEGVETEAELAMNDEFAKFLCVDSNESNRQDAS